jgi:parallel beta helix pectate lyase-like protein
MHIRTAHLFCALVALIMISASHAAQRTFVSVAGVDNPACSLSSPCRTFGTAVAATSSEGEVIVLDSGGYGPVTITQAVSIIAPPGVYAGISVFTGVGIAVNAPGASVVLRGLTINGQGGGSKAGINVTSAQVVHIERCTVTNLGDGISIDGTAHAYITDSLMLRTAGVFGGAASGDLNVSDTHIANHNGGEGIRVFGGALTLNRVEIDNSGTGVSVVPFSPAQVVIRDSAFTGNTFGVTAITNAAGQIAHVAVERSAALRNMGSGFIANSVAGGTVTFVLSDSVSIENGQSGLFAGGAGTTASVGGSTLSRNGNAGLFQTSSAVLNSHGNNAVTGNVLNNITGTVTVIGLN